MAEITFRADRPGNIDFRLPVRWVLFLPKEARLYESLGGPYDYWDIPYEPRSYPYCTDSGALLIPVDLISAARLKLIKPGDNSGLGEEQWAWLKLIGLVGEK